jgi:polysaccharide biosynthesis/export protein
MKLRFIFAVIISVFLCGLASAQITLPPNFAAGGSKGYLVGPGDQITVKVLGDDQFDFIATVDEDGRLEAPYGNKAVYAKCKTEKEIRDEVKALLAVYLRDPQVNLRVTERKSRPPVSIYGEVRTPGQVGLTRRTTLIELIAFSGGITDEAGGMVQVFRTQPPMCAEDAASNWATDVEAAKEVPSRMFKVSALKQGQEDANPVVYPGDVIVIQKAPPIFIVGEVVAPQGIYLKESMTLTEAISKVGGLRPEAKSKDIKIYRLKQNANNTKDREVISANMALIKTGQQKDVMLMPQDIIEVDHAKDSIGMSIFKVAVGLGKAGATAAVTGGGYRGLD